MTAPYRVGVWCAVSSKPQAQDDKESLPAQRHAGQQFAQDHNGQVVAIYEVPGHTRDYWSWFEAETEVPAYRQVREDLQAGRLDVIHCMDVDRLGRDPAIIHQFYSLAERNNCEIYDASMPHVLGQQSMGHRYGMSVKSVSAGEDQRRRTARHRMGMRGRARRGLHANHWPIGYSPVRDDAGQVVGAEFDDLIGAVDLMTRMFIAGHSYRRIRNALAASAWELPGGRPWHEIMVRRCMQSDVYAGYTTWGEVRSEEPSEHYPALWDAATHASILRESESRKSSYTHRKAGPLSGAAICHRCGTNMTRTKMRHKDEYYLRCGRHAMKARKPTGQSCHPNYIRELDVMDAIGEWVARFTSAQAIEQALAQHTGAGDIEREMEQVNKNLARLAPERRRLARAFAQGKMDLDIYHDTDRELRDAQGAAEVRQAGLIAMSAARPDPETVRQYIEELLSQGLDLSQLPPDTLRAALHKAGVKAFIEEGAVLFCAFST